MAVNYGAECRRLADEYFALTGEMPFSGTEQRGPARKLYLFSSGGPIDNGPEALGHMRELLAAVTPDLQPGDPIPPERTGGLPGFVVASCRHRIAASEWRAGFRNCERCPERTLRQGFAANA
jgi:hypothetical protein